MIVDDAAVRFLLRFLDTASVSPLEGGDPKETRRAQEQFTGFARDLGFDVAWDVADLGALLADPSTPAPVREHARDQAWLDDQPIVAATLGDPGAPRSLVVDAHVDTVSPHLPVTLRDGTVRARGAVDDKGPAVAATCGVAAAYRRDPDLARRVRTTVLSVPGEEGGAMGSYGTRPALDRLGPASLLLFAEPTGLTTHDTAFATMTLQVAVDAPDSTDDFPYRHANATVVLGVITAELARGLREFAEDERLRCCVAGLHTGLRHNRVYGSGTLLVNIGYCDTALGAAVRDRVDDLLDDAVDRVARDFAGYRLGRAWAGELAGVVRRRWLKQGLPSLRNRSARWEAALAACGLGRLPGDQLTAAFTSDAIWGQGAAEYTVVCGPGGLDSHGAHTDDEHVSVAELEEYARRIALLVQRVAHTPDGGPR